MNSEMIPSRVVKLPKMADVVARDLRTWIVRGTLKEGARLPPLERLASQFGVSLAVVREAVRILETEGLLEIQRGAIGGIAVKTPTLDVVARAVGLYLQYHKVTVEDLLTARLGMEPFAAARLATKPTPKAIRTLETLIEKAQSCLDDPLAFAKAATAFHQAIVALAHNKTLSVVHAAVLNIVEAELASMAARRGKGPSTADRREKSVKSYYHLLNLIKAGDARGAEQHWTRHLENQAKSLLTLDHGKLIIDLFAPAGADAPPVAVLEAAERAPPQDLGARRSKAAAGGATRPAVSRVARPRATG
jgi:GntR family transcriptional repressor for pyruvate dehydrogenase complex